MLQRVKAGQSQPLVAGQLLLQWVVEEQLLRVVVVAVLLQRQVVAGQLQFFEEGRHLHGLKP